MSTEHNDVSFSIVNEEDISPQLDEAIREMLVVCFPADRQYFQRQRWWHCVPIYRALGRNDEGSIGAHTAVVERIVIVGPALSKVRVVGIQSFCVLQDYRHTGLSNKMMSVAMEEAGRRGFDAGLLFCQKPLEKVYGQMGWSRLDAAVYMADDEKGQTLIPARNITMFYPLKAKQFPAGDIDLAGTDW
jgi:GNAT superfamily N-acetyltransferase